MSTSAVQVEEQQPVKRYKIQYPVSAYVFPREACIHRVRFDDDYMHVELTDGRVLSLPLWWIPTLHNAAPEEREKYEINRSRTMIIWDPDKCAINDEVRIADYLGSAAGMPDHRARRPRGERVPADPGRTTAARPAMPRRVAGGG